MPRTEKELDQEYKNIVGSPTRGLEMAKEETILRCETDEAIDIEALSKESQRQKSRGLEIVILGEPVAKGRPRATFNKKAGKIFVYTPDKTSEATNLIRDKVKDFKPFDRKIPLSLEIWVYRSKPKSIPKRQEHPVSRPDWDNYGKLVTDAMEKFCYVDDAQLIDVTVHKRYAGKPRIEVRLEEIECQK